MRTNLHFGGVIAQRQGLFPGSPHSLSLTDDDVLANAALLKKYRQPPQTALPKSQTQPVSQDVLYIENDSDDGFGFLVNDELHQPTNDELVLTAKMIQSAERMGEDEKEEYISAIIRLAVRRLKAIKEDPIAALTALVQLINVQPSA